MLCCENGENDKFQTHTHTQKSRAFTHTYMQTQLCAFNETVLQKKRKFTANQKTKERKQKIN